MESLVGLLGIRSEMELILVLLRWLRLGLGRRLGGLFE